MVNRHATATFPYTARGEWHGHEAALDYRLGVAGRSIRRDSPFGRRSEPRRGGSALMNAACGLVRFWPIPGPAPIRVRCRRYLSVSNARLDRPLSGPRLNGTMDHCRLSIDKQIGGLGSGIGLQVVMVGLVATVAFGDVHGGVRSMDNLIDQGLVVVLTYALQRHTCTAHARGHRAG